MTAMPDTLVSHFILPAAPARVYEAWTTPAIIQAWWGALDQFKTRYTHEPRVGGQWRAEFTTPAGDVYACYGEYRRLEPGQALALTYQFSWAPDDAPILAEFEFEAEGPETIGTLTQTGAITDDMRKDGEGGWSVTLDFLRKYLAAKARAA